MSRQTSTQPSSPGRVAAVCPRSCPASWEPRARRRGRGRSALAAQGLDQIGVTTSAQPSGRGSGFRGSGRAVLGEAPVDGLPALGAGVAEVGDGRASAAGPAMTAATSAPALSLWRSVIARLADARRGGERPRSYVPRLTDTGTSSSDGGDLDRLVDARVEWARHSATTVTLRCRYVTSTERHRAGPRRERLHAATERATRSAGAPRPARRRRPRRPRRRSGRCRARR